MAPPLGKDGSTALSAAIRDVRGLLWGHGVGSALLRFVQAIVVATRPQTARPDPGPGPYSEKARTTGALTKSGAAGSCTCPEVSRYDRRLAPRGLGSWSIDLHDAERRRVSSRDQDPSEGKEGRGVT